MFPRCRNQSIDARMYVFIKNILHVRTFFRRRVPCIFHNGARRVERPGRLRLRFNYRLSEFPARRLFIFPQKLATGLVRTF